MPGPYGARLGQARGRGLRSLHLRLRDVRAHRAGDAADRIGAVAFESVAGPELRLTSMQESARMLDTQNQGPQCTACGSPMKLTAIEPSALDKDLRTFTCPQCTRVQRHIIASAVTEAWLAPRK